MQTLLLGKRLTAAVTEHPTEGSLPSQRDTVSECCVWGYRKGKWKNLLKMIFLFFKNGQINLSFALCLSLSQVVDLVQFSLMPAAVPQNMVIWVNLTPRILLGHR